jgi:hypothetical protein
MDGGELVLRIIIMLAFGAGSAAVANSKGRNPIGWFFVGFLFSCIGLIISLCMSNEKERSAQFEAQNIQNRRLQEQLKQEQMKTESLRQHTLSRLDKHDTVLGIDTKETAPQLTMQNQPQNPLGSAPKLEDSDPANQSEIWHYHYDGTQRGPTSINELFKLKSMNAFSEESLVWKEGMQNWEQAKYQPELAKILYS